MNKKLLIYVITIFILFTGISAAYVINSKDKEEKKQELDYCFNTEKDLKDQFDKSASPLDNIDIEIANNPGSDKRKTIISQIKNLKGKCVNDALTIMYEIGIREVRDMTQCWSTEPKCLQKPDVYRFSRVSYSLIDNRINEIIQG